MFVLHSAEVAQIDGVLRLAFAAIDHFVAGDIGKDLFNKEVTIRAANLPERQ